MEMEFKEILVFVIISIWSNFINLYRIYIFTDSYNHIMQVKSKVQSDIYVYIYYFAYFRSLFINLNRKNKILKLKNLNVTKYWKYLLYKQ